MKWILPLLVIGWLVAEVVTFVVNPFNAPASQLPMRLFGLQYFEEQDVTMEPTVAADQYVLITGWPYRHHAPAVGDIAAFSDPSHPDVLQLRRIVADGGSSVAIRHGVIYINGQRQLEGWLLGQTIESDRSLDMPIRHVPADHYFMMGDNRDVSEDSREWGPIDHRAILGRKW